MELEKLTERISYLAPQPEREYPLLAHVRGDRFSLAVDAGYSARHLALFYEGIDSAGLKRPDFTVLTHWHCDHSFALHAAAGVGIAFKRTNDKLKEHIVKSTTMPNYREYMMCDPFYGVEYPEGAPVTVKAAEIEFTDSLTLDLGGVTAQIFHIDSPHTFDAVCVLVPEEKVLFLGDAIYGDYQHDWVMNEPKLRAMIALVESTDCDWCVAGHAKPHSKQTMLRHLTRKLEK